MRRLLVMGLLATIATPLRGQGVPTGRLEASYVVRVDGKEVGRERLVVRPAQISQGRVGTRWELESERLTGDDLRGVLSQSSDGHLDALQLEARGAEGSSTLRAVHRGSRLVISLTGDRIRRARELPAGEHSVLLDEQLHGLIFVVKDLATDDGVELTGVFPRTGNRITFTATRQAGTQGGSVIVLAGGLTGRLTVNADGLVDRLELTSPRITLERLRS